MTIGLVGGRRTAVFSAALVVLACSDESQPVGMAVRDSAGVRVIDLPSASTVSSQFALSETPVYRVGWNPEDRQFEDVVSGSLRPDGSAVVGDGGGTLQLVFLSPSGRVDAVVGGPGRGPGELRSLHGIVFLAKDSVAVHDPENARVTIFTPAGAHTTISLTFPRPPYLLGRDEESNFLLGPPLQFVVGRLYETAWLKVPLVKLAATGTADTLEWADWDQSISVGGGRSPFMSGGFATAANGRFVIGRGDRPEIRWLDQRGALRQIARWSEPARTVREGDVAAWETELRASLERVGTLTQADKEQFISAQKGAIEEPAPYFGAAGPMPRYGGILADPLGNVWIAAFRVPRVRVPGHYLILSPQGRWSRRVEVHAGLRVLAVGADHVLGIEEDAFDRQAVALYRLVDAGLN